MKKAKRLQSLTLFNNKVLFLFSRMQIYLYSLRKIEILYYLCGVK